MFSFTYSASNTLCRMRRIILYSSRYTSKYDSVMKCNNKSKLRMAWNLMNQRPQDWEASEIISYVGILIPLLIIIIYWHLYLELFFYLGFLAIVGWLFFWLTSEIFKPNLSSKRLNKLATFGFNFLVYFMILAIWAFFSYILGSKLGGGSNFSIAIGAFFYSFGGAVLLWRTVLIAIKALRGK
jgi:hypothetical protein